MGKVGSDTGSVDNIVERELVDKGARLEEQREGLVFVSAAWFNRQLRRRKIVLT